jgi:hypothetical protein
MHDSLKAVNDEDKRLTNEDVFREKEGEDADLHCK